MVRSTESAPAQSIHAVSLELSRILDFIGRQGEASRVIQWNMLRFPDEWKLVLERVNQLFRENRALDAYHLCIASLRRDPTAGRLWSSFIQIAHQFFSLSHRSMQIIRSVRGASAVLRGAEVRRALRRSVVRRRARVPQPHLPAFQPPQRAALPHVRRPLHAPIRRLLHRGFSVSTLPSRPSGSP